ncbi:MAG: hypothetical protein JWR07_447 [Nevskia sp.]|nr:hypothetical protein [Nevskia sp.]
MRTRGSARHSQQNAPHFANPRLHAFGRFLPRPPLWGCFAWRRSGLASWVPSVPTSGALLIAKSILVAKPKTEKLAAHISQELYKRIQAVQSRLKALSNDVVFPLDEIVEDALQRATQLAEVELAMRDLRAGAPSTH